MYSILKHPLKFELNTSIGRHEEPALCSYIVHEDSQLLRSWSDSLTDDPEVAGIGHQTVSLTQRRENNESTEIGLNQCQIDVYFKN